MIKTLKPCSCLLNIQTTHLPQRFYTAVQNISLTHFPTVHQDFYFSHLLGQPVHLQIGLFSTIFSAARTRIGRQTQGRASWVDVLVW